MRVSIGLPVADWAASAAAARQAEDDGADAVTASELKHDPFTPLAFVARATYDDLPAAIEKRYGGIVDSVSLDFVPGTSAATRRAVIAAVQRIPSTFKGFRR